MRTSRIESGKSEAESQNQWGWNLRRVPVSSGKHEL